MVDAVNVYSNGSYVLDTATFHVYLMDVSMVGVKYVLIIVTVCIMDKAMFGVCVICT